MLTRDVAVVGVGYSPPVRHGAPSIDAMTRTASLAALSDAGLVPADVDAVVEYSFSGRIPRWRHVRNDCSVSQTWPCSTTSWDLGRQGWPAPWTPRWRSPRAVPRPPLVYRTITRDASHTGAYTRRSARGPWTVGVHVPLRLWRRDHDGHRHEDASTNGRVEHHAGRLRADRPERSPLGRRQRPGRPARRDHNGRLRRLGRSRSHSCFWIATIRSSERRLRC